MVLGGPTVVFEVGGLRFLTDPTFDPPTDYGALRKRLGPALSAADVEPVDVVLLSHAAHADNLDVAGREVARRAPLVLTTPSAAPTIGPNTRGLRVWESCPVAPDVEVTAVPAQHGPADGATDEDGFVNCEVSGFVVRAQDRTTYVSGDNASLRLVRQIHDRIGRMDHAVLFAGRASVPAKFESRPLSLSAERASAAADILEAGHVVVAHQTGWDHFTQGPAETRAAFEEAGLSAILHRGALGEWCRRPW